MHRRMESRKVPRGAQSRIHNGIEQVKIKVGGIMQWCDVLVSGRARVIRPEWCGSVRMADGRIITHKLLRDKIASERMLQNLQIKQDRIAAGLESAPREISENLSQILERFFNVAASRDGLSRTYCDRLRATLPEILNQLNIQRLDQLQLLSPEMISTWCNEKLASNSSGNVKYYLNILSKFLRWLHKEKIIGMLPELPQVTYRPSKIHRDLKLSEVQRLAKHAPWPRNLFYKFAFATIARCNAILQLVAEDLHLDDVAGPWVLFRTQHSKTKTATRCPIPRDLIPDLKRLIRECPAGCTLWHKMPRGGLFDAFKSDLKRAGIPKETAEGTAVVHSLRHGGTTHMLEQGVQLSLVQEMGGWKSPKVLLAHYSHLSPMRNRGEIDRAMGGNSGKRIESGFVKRKGKAT